MAQTGQIFDVLHRQGNVHDSNGAVAFIEACVEGARVRLPRAKVESRMDCAFFSEELIVALKRLSMEFSISVPFRRLPALKTLIEGTKRWKRLDGRWSYHEVKWA